MQALRGLDLIVSVTLATKIGDPRRLESPRQLMGYFGLVPGERSSGGTVQRGSITMGARSFDRLCRPRHGHRIQTNQPTIRRPKASNTTAR